MASTDDCKKFLAQNEQTQNETNWKRQSKKKVDGKTQREFLAPSGAVALVGEDDTGALFLISYADAFAVHEQTATAPASLSVQAIKQKAKKSSTPKQPSLNGLPPIPSGFNQPNPSKAANYIFALLDDPEEEKVLAIVVGKDFWDKHQCFEDDFMPIHDILPGISPESPNETSRWILSGFSSSSHMAQAMIDYGFEFSPDLQKFCDQINPYPNQSWDARNAIKRLRDQHLGKPVKFLNPYAKRKIAGGTAEPNFTIISDDSDIFRLAQRIDTNKERDERAFKNLRPMADAQIALVIMPPESDPNHQSVKNGLEQIYENSQAYSTTIIGVKHNSSAHQHLSAQLGHLEVGTVVGFQGHIRPYGDTADDHPPTKIDFPHKLTMRSVDVQATVNQILGKKVTPIWKMR